MPSASSSSNWFKRFLLLRWYTSKQTGSINPPLCCCCWWYNSTNLITSRLVGVRSIGPPHVILNSSMGSYQSVTTLAFTTDDEQIDKFFNEILSTIEHSPSLAKKISTAHIEKLCSKNNFSVAVKLLHLLRDKHVFLGANAYNSLLVAAGEANDIELVAQIFKDLLVSNQPVSSTTYLNLAKALKGVKDEIWLLGFVKEVSELTFPRNTTFVNRIIYAFDVCGQINKALLIYDHMKSLKCKLDLFTYNTVLGILGRVGRVDEMLHEIAWMKDANIVPDIVSYNTLINSFRKLGRLDLCSMFLEEVKERGLELDLRTYTALIDCFGHSGNIDESLRLFTEMKSKCIIPSIYIYRSLIHNLKKMGRTEMAVMLLEEMNASLANLVGPEDFKRKKR